MGQIILRLDRVMADRKISLKELSEKVGVTNVNLSKMKTGKISAIRFSTLEAICDALDCQPGDILEYINLKMKFKRIELNLSQTELAEKVGVTRQTIGLIEAGDFNPSIKLCIAICNALGVTLNDLFWEEEENENA